MPAACATPAAARPPLPVSRRLPPPSAAHVLSRRALSSSTTACRCTTASAAPSTWDWTRWSRHFAEVDQAESYASVLSFQLEEAVDTEDFAEAATLKRAILEASADDAVAHVMAELKSAIEEQRYQDASRLTKLAGTSLVGWWVGYAKDTDDSIGRIVRISPGVGRYVAKSYSPRQLVTASSGSPLFEIFLVRDQDETYTMKVVHLRPTKGTSSTSSISSTATEDPVKVESGSSLESSALPEGITEEANTDTTLKGTEDVEEKVQDVGRTKESGVEGLKSVLNFFKSRIPEFKVQVINVDVPEETELVADSSEELVQDDVKSTSESSLEEPSTEEFQEEDASDEDSDSNDDKSPEVKLFISGVVHNKDDAGAKSYVRVPAEINNLERDSFELYIPGKGSDRDLAETKAAKQKVADMAAKLASELMPSDVAKALWGTTKSSSKINKEVQELLKLTLSKARVKLTENTIFNRITTDSNGSDPFNGLYVGAFSPYGPEVVQLRRKFGHWNSTDEVGFFEYVEAVKLTGDLSVPAGQITFRAKVGKGSRLENRGAYPEEFGVTASYKGQGRIAQPGFKNPRWVDGELLVLNGKSAIPHLGGAELGFLYSVPEQSFLVLFDRLTLPE
ncbi:protein EXECUTER 2, chloroplastic-like [Lolium rigidum]|uniref:protein EXECUTER 2, chloroplastic-like n=1 Tax=Lolium rigidum TaxID=89674 RepID=UPI001F5D0359|nr:protein EXECUTER 2, chloroplastic-like [Lolium rigidum]